MTQRNIMCIICGANNSRMLRRYMHFVRGIIIFFFRFALCCRFVCFVQSSISKRQMSEHKHGWLVVATYSKMIKLPTIFTKEQPQGNSNLYRQLASGQPSINRVSQTIGGFIVGSPLSPLANKELCTVKTL